MGAKRGTGWPMNGHARRRKLRALLKRDGLDACWLCGEPMLLHPRNARGAATIDHVVPVSEGGSNALSNLALAHRYCNNTRHNGPPAR